MGWREQQTELTRQRIIQTFLELSESGRRASIAEVVRHSGISSATVFRHFANRAALVTAAANRDVTKGVEPDQESWGLGDFLEHTRQIWQSMADNLAVAREGTVSDAGRELRAARFREFRPVCSPRCVAPGSTPPGSTRLRRRSACSPPHPRSSTSTTVRG
ncbi:MAG: TetR/AcrR family transcriptional regulator [Microthrixaceae bacterium]